MTVITVNGNTYSDDGSTPKDMNDGGSADWFFPLVQDTMTDTAAKVASCAASESAAAISAAAAINAPGTGATSTSSLAVGLGTKNLTIQTAKAFVPGMWVTISRTSDPSNYWMNGVITAYNSGTGALTVDSKRAQGIATTTGWTVTLSAPGAYAAGGARSVTAGSPSPSVSVGVSDLRYQRMQPTSSGANYSFSGITSNIAGPAYYTLRNKVGDYGFDISAGQSGASQGFISPGKEVTVNVDSVGGLDFNNARAYGSDVMAKVVFGSVVAGTSGLYTKSVTVDSDTTLILVHGASLWAVLYTESVAQFSAPLLLRASMSAAGEDASVLAVPLLDGTQNVLVASCPNGSTALQTVVVQIASGALSLGAVTSTTLGSAAARLVDLVPVGATATSFALGTMVSTTTLQAFAILVAGSSTNTVSATPVATTTSGSWGAILSVPGTDMYLALTATGTVLGAKPVTITPGTVTQAPGTSGTSTTTSNAGLAIRYDSSLSAWGMTLTNTTAKAVKLTVSGTTAAFSAQTTIQAVVTTINTLACGGAAFDIVGDYFYAAVSGTDSSGRFAVETFSMSLGGSAPSVSLSGVMYMAAAAVPVYAVGGFWQIASATEAVLWTLANYGLGTATPDEYRMPGMATYAQILQVPDPLTPKAPKARSTMRSASRAVALLDGAKNSVQYSLGYAEATRDPVRLINTPLNSVNLSGETGYIWAVAGPAPSTTLTIQKLRLV